MIVRNDILASASQAGFQLCAMARCRPLEAFRPHFERWLEEGMGSGLDYLKRNIDKRFDPARLFEGAVSIVVCAVNYRSVITGGYVPDDRGKIASYACAEDYHRIIKDMLFDLLGRLRQRYPELIGRPFVDSAPLLEKPWAVEAGLGWIGRNSLLLTPEFGSTVLLGELLLCDEIDSYDAPIETAGCGECRRCIDVCPTGAIVREGVIDTRRCISRLTIERDTETGGALHGWIFGCEECQNVCPYNRSKPLYTLPRFAPVIDPRRISREQWQSMTDSEFDARFGATPLARSGRARIVKNLDRE